MRSNRSHIAPLLIVACAVLFGMEGSSMMIGNTGAFLTGKLPYDAEVEYIESTGTQWIDTGVIANRNTHATLVMANSTVDGRWLFGARAGYLSRAYGVYYDGSGTNVLNAAFGSQVISPVPTYTTTNVGRVTMDFNGKVLSVSRELVPYNYEYTFNAEKFTTPVPVSLFGLNNNGSRISLSSFRCYSFKIGDILDLQPVRVGNEGAMYDRVSGQLFRNQGTGAFLYGADKTA